MYAYDLQTHTHLSDGDYPFVTLVTLAKKAKLKGLVVTDHNIAHGINQRAEALKKAGFETVVGVEISAKYKGIEVHILGYGLMLDEAVLQRGLQATQDGYDARSKAMIEAINASGVALIEFNELKHQRGVGVCVLKYDVGKALATALGIPVAKALTMLNRGGEFYLPYGEWALPPQEAITLIHQAGGKAVFSHPGETRRKAGSKVFDSLFKLLLKAGLDGIEVFTPKHNREEQTYFQCLVDQHNLFATGGSDYHGEQHHPELPLGSGGLNREDFLLFIRALKGFGR